MEGSLSAAYRLPFLTTCHPKMYTHLTYLTIFCPFVLPQWEGART
jgi:hypothetical protein